MSRPRELRFNAFNMTAPSHNWAGLWSHPRDASIHYNTLDYWIDYARTAERGLLDGIFLADVFGVYDVLATVRTRRFAQAVQLAQRRTDAARLGDGAGHQASRFRHHIEPDVRTSLSACATFFDARSPHPADASAGTSSPAISTAARAAWAMPAGRAHDDRYDAAEDFLDAAYKLWEGSWETMRSAAIATRASSPTPQRYIRSSTGPLLSRQRHSPLPSRRRSARPCCIRRGPRNAAAPSPPDMRKRFFSTARPNRSWPAPCARSGGAAKEFGRDPYDIRCSQVATVIVAPTRAEANDILEDYARHVDRRPARAALGLDRHRFLDLPPGSGLSQYVESNAIQSMVENFTLRSDRPVKIGDLASLSRVGRALAVRRRLAAGRGRRTDRLGRARPMSMVSTCSGWWCRNR